MSTVYEQHRDEDGFMYMMYSGENTFGALEVASALEAGGAVTDEEAKEARRMA